MFGRETGGSNCLGNSLVLFLIMSSIATAINTKTPVLMSIVATMEFFLHMVGLHGRQISYLAAVRAAEYLGLMSRRGFRGTTANTQILASPE